MFWDERYDLLDVELRSHLGLYFWTRALDVAPLPDRRFRVFADYVTDIAAALRARGWNVHAIMNAITRPLVEQAAVDAALSVPEAAPARSRPAETPRDYPGTVTSPARPRYTCGAPTRRGTPCRWRAEDCPVRLHEIYRSLAELTNLRRMLRVVRQITAAEVAERRSQHPDNGERRKLAHVFSGRYANDTARRL